MKTRKWYVYVNALSDLGSRMDLIAFSALIFTFENSAMWLTAFFLPDKWEAFCSVWRRG